MSVDSRDSFELLQAVLAMAAADGRVTTHEIGPQSTRFIAELAEVYVGYRAGVRGATEDSQGRPTARLTPTQQAALRLTFQVRVQLGN